MAIERSLLPDGKTIHHQVADPELTAMKTGPIQGFVTCADGTSYNVDDEWIAVPLAKAGEVSHLIGLRYQNEGHASHRDGTPFVHTCIGCCSHECSKACFDSAPQEG